MCGIFRKYYWTTIILYIAHTSCIYTIVVRRIFQLEHIPHQHEWFRQYNAVQSYDVVVVE